MQQQEAFIGAAQHPQTPRAPWRPPGSRSRPWSPRGTGWASVQYGRRRRGSWSTWTSTRRPCAGGARTARRSRRCTWDTGSDAWPCAARTRAATWWLLAPAWASWTGTQSRCSGWLSWTDRNPTTGSTTAKWTPRGGTMPEPLAPGVWEPAQGSLYSLQGNHSVLRLADRLGIPNGLDWSTDQRTFYHVDSLDYAVHAYDYDVQAGTIGNRRLLFQLPPGRAMPDGLCVDSVGTLWVACIDGGKIIRLDPQTGSCLCTVDLPVTRVTSCCFGGPDYSDLYVTSAADGLSQEQLQREPQAGHVFKVSGLGVRGRPCFPFLG
ncbi:regucalcin isoform X4 [Mesocricetus auratus]|uniref:Regucalcin n=1 Tax=Mesocricetus auratus TaxID=10036 RepID=A0ABM2W8U2_MESAU|nr:regucalcin isoform X4 [Mesocricetus auratus]